MKLTDYESGIIFEFDAADFGSANNRGPYREVRTTAYDFFKKSMVYKVRESVLDIIKLVQAEKGAQENVRGSNQTV